MDLPTYPSFQRPTIGGLVKTGRLKPRVEPGIGRHSEEQVNPQAVSVADLAERIASKVTVDWFTAQTVRIPRALPALGGAA